MSTQLNRIVCGDCIAGLKALDAGSVDLAFADPPFNIGYTYDEYDDKQTADHYLDWSREWISGVIRVLKPSGAFWLAIGDEYAAELKVLATRELGLTCRNWVVWYYTFGVHCKYKFTRSHAHLFYFVKDADDFTFNAQHPVGHPESIRVPSARQLVYGDRRANPMGRMPDDTWIIAPDLDPATPQAAGPQVEGQNGRTGRTPAPADGQRRANNGSQAATGGNVPESTRADHAPEPATGGDAPEAAAGAARPKGWILRPQDLPDGFAADSDTWYYPRVCGTFKQRMGFHGCQMPEQILGRIIRACSNEGDVVLDPFTGSGTTLAVAKKLGRQYIGFELSKAYADQVRLRLGDIAHGDPLDGVVDPLTSVANTANGKVRTPDGRRVPQSAAGPRRKTNGTRRERAGGQLRRYK
ncbi:MAG: DNA-methyltransferase [Phycisphaerae bacterium]